MTKITDEEKLTQARQWYFSGRGNIPGKENNHHCIEQRYPLTGNHGEVIVWKAPNTNVNSLIYVIFGRYLSVFGDLGDAVYAWSSNINVAFLAGCNVDYFEGKCQASPYGRHFQSWNGERCCGCIQEHLLESVRNHIGEGYDEDEMFSAVKTFREKDATLTDDQAFDIIIKELTDKALAKPSDDKKIERLKELALDARNHSESEHEWGLFITSDDGEEFLGSDAWELSDWGMEIDMLCYAHLAGLQMIYEQEQAAVATAKRIYKELREALNPFEGKMASALTKACMLDALRAKIAQLMDDGTITTPEKPEFDVVPSESDPTTILIVPINGVAKELFQKASSAENTEGTDGISKTEDQGI